MMSATSCVRADMGDRASAFHDPEGMAVDRLEPSGCGVGQRARRTRA